MSDTVISVENLSKSYLIGHGGPREKYHSLRDTIMRHGRNYARKAIDMARGLQIIQGDSVEEFWALKDVSFEVKRGEMLGIIGRNGAGKSTLLKILSRITEPTTGRVTLEGRVASLLEVGTGFHPELTGHENIFLNGAILGMTKVEIKKKFDEIVDFAGVEKFLDTPVKRYSSGMYVRLAFAVAAHLEPEILIIDEVLAVGDAEFQKKCLGKMQDVAGQGRTVLFVSHNMGAVSQLTKKCVLLGSGQIILNGKTEAAIEKYSGFQDNQQITSFPVELQQREYPGNEKARILNLRFDRNLPNFLSDENFSFHIRIRANENLARLRVSFTIFTADGIPVGGAFSSDSRQMRALEESEFRVTLSRPNLAPGYYYCDVGIGSGNPGSGHIDYDVVTNTLQFEIFPSTGDDNTVSYWTKGWGRIIFPQPHVEMIP